MPRIQGDGRGGAQGARRASSSAGDGEGLPAGRVRLTAPRSSTRACEVERIQAGARRRSERDTIVVEEPLEIRVAGDTLAVTMRTPGHDRELVMGFLLAEGIVTSKDDVTALTHCGRTGAEERENVIEVTLAPGVRTPLDDVDAPLFGGASRRGTITASACGVCGRRTIDDLLARATPLAEAGPAESADAAVLSRAMQALGDHQPVFAATGGCHAAMLMTLAGEHVATYEDVGRHNAVDKVIGSRVLAGSLPLGGHVLAVSGRASFEIVQKAIVAKIPIVASVSAPSSLAVDLAARANVTLLGFVRGDRATIYTGAARVV
ncbi:MAG: formate dehydrogenase accessory sulfurtransferase FdhD [Deltaproteobacteria bacterium]|nr:formate dehydrogenase accessory sulfurtransferase FdhD [Deltaproteobacteria bacterium]